MTDVPLTLYEQGQARARYEIESKARTKPRHITKHMNAEYTKGYADEWRKAQVGDWQFWYDTGKAAYHPLKQGYGIWLRVDTDLERNEASLAAFWQGWNSNKEAK